MQFFIYCRKSSEDSNRQVQSISDQKRILSELALIRGFKIVKIFEESASAKAPGRPKFNDMMDRIEQGEADGLLCWKLDRLARNPVCGGRVGWLLNQGVIKQIVTPERDYFPQDNVLMMTLEFGMAHEFINSLSKNVRRGLDSKVLKGWFPGIPPLGYKNDLENHTIVPDEDRWDMVRKMWDMLLGGKYYPTKIVNIANSEWGFRTKRRRKIGGNPMSESVIYKMFQNPFYYGFFELKGELHQGNHKPMITKEEFDTAQGLIGKKRIRKDKNIHFPFTGLIQCGECGCMVTAEKREMRNKTNSRVRTYTYYHCTHRRDSRREQPCSQRKHMNEKDMEDAIRALLKTIYISTPFKEWAWEILLEAGHKDEAEREANIQRLQKEVHSIEQRLDNLLQLKISTLNLDGALLNDDEYKEQKGELLKEKQDLLEHIKSSRSISKTVDAHLEVFEIASKCLTLFECGTSEEKKHLLRGILESLTLKNGTIEFKLKPPFEAIRDGLKQIEAIEKERFECLRTATEKEELSLSNSSVLVWQGLQESNPR
ncbi:MAG: recombinase family protein [Candidatus Gracilibacteria bacterium]